MRRTKIVATFGPSCSNEETIRRLLEVGVNVFRFNFSHSTPEEHVENARKVRRIANSMGINVSFMQDLSGPKIRIGKLSGEIELKEGDTVDLAPEDEAADGEIPISFKELYRYVETGDEILIADGTIVLKVRNVVGRRIKAEIKQGGRISSYKGLNIPSKAFDIPALTDKDVRDLEIGMQFGFDYVAMSFVQKSSDIDLLRYHIRRLNSDAKIIAKIEKPAAVARFDEILDASDAIMIARGDLGIEIPIEDLPLLQKRFIAQSINKGKPVITATQMLESMIHSPTPTRAEVTDVANAVLDGSDALMLSGETAIGKYPIQAVKIMDRIIRKVESQENYFRRFQDVSKRDTKVDNSVAFAAYELAKFSNSAVIVAFTFSGGTASRIARFRPKQPIVAITPNSYVARQLSLLWGVVPFLSQTVDTFEDMLRIARKVVKKLNLAREYEKIVVVAGLPLKTPGNTNLIHITDVY